MGRVFLAVFLVAAFAQTAPVLHSRGDHEQAQPTRAAKGVSTLPEDASGEYVLDGRGSVIQITLEHGRLSGYVSKMEGETALTLFFDRTSVNGNRVSFATKTVHGLRYSFRGAIVRGEAAERSLSGFYRLAGELTAYRGGTPEMRRVGLKSTPRLR